MSLLHIPFVAGRRRFWRALIAAIAGLLVTLPALRVFDANAQSPYARYVWEKAWFIPSASPSPAEQEVRDELQAEIQKVIDFCCAGRPTPRHLGPFYVAPGYIAEDLFWLDPGETVLALSEALEFIPAGQRVEMIRYLKFEMQSPVYSPLTYLIRNGVASPLLDPANFRSLYPALPAELARGYMQSGWTEQLSPRPQDLYAAWAFAYYTSRYEAPGDSPTAWQIISDRWASIDQIFNNTIPATPRTYWQVMGAIGYARMARQLGKPYATAEQRAINGLAAGVNYVQFYRSMATVEGCQGNQGLDGWVGVWDYCGFTAVNPNNLYNSQFSHTGYAGQELDNKPSMFAIEIGRFLKENAQTAVVNHVNRYLSPGGAAYFPFWWENRGVKPWAIRDENTPMDGNGENAIMHPSFAWQMFMLRAHVFSGVTADEMKKYLDTPWAIGDVFHLQRLVSVLRLYATTEWLDLDPLASRMTASVGGARQGQAVTFTLSLIGTGRRTTVVDRLPAQLAYLSHASSCPGAASYDAGALQVTYSNTPTLGATCALTIATRVAVSDTIAVVNSASVDNGLAPIYHIAATVILNGRQVYLPIILKWR